MARRVVFLSGYDGELREPFVWPQGCPVSFRVARQRAALFSTHRVESALRGIEGGISRSFSSCGKKLWVPSTCDGDLRELLRVTMGSQEYCGVVRGHLGLHWVWCNGRGPHLELRWEPQGSSPVLTWVSGCVCRVKQEVRSGRGWRHGTLLSSRVSSLQPS